MWYKWNIEHRHDKPKSSDTIADIWKNVEPDPWYKKAAEIRFKREVRQAIEKDYEEIRKIMKDFY